MRAVFEVAHTFGWRASEITGLRVNQIDLLNRIIRLNPGETKNDDGRVVVMTNAVFELLCQCVKGKKPSDYVFTHPDGSAVSSFYKAWWKACVTAGLGHMVTITCREKMTDWKPQRGFGSRNLKYFGLLSMIFAECVRNMVRRGIPEVVAMRISGHKTRAVFDRYNIVSESDLREAARKMEPEIPQAENDHTSIIQAPKQVQLQNEEQSISLLPSVS